MAGEFLNAAFAAVHSLTSSSCALKMFFSTLTALNGGGRIGIETSRAMSHETETLAWTRAIGPRLRGGLGNCLAVWFLTDIAAAAGGAETPLRPLLQFPATLLESLASRRGSSKLVVTSALIWLKKLKPIGIAGLNARPRMISTSVRFTFTGSGVRLVSWKPTTLLLPRFVSSTRRLEPSGTLRSRPAVTSSPPLTWNSKRTRGSKTAPAWPMPGMVKPAMGTWKRATSSMPLLVGRAKSSSRAPTPMA